MPSSLICDADADADANLANVFSMKLLNKVQAAFPLT
jgi:hypothetical protein